MHRTEIDVNYDRSKDKLTIDPATVDLRETEWIEWKFSGLNEEEFGFVSFQTRFGPLHSLRSYSNTSVLGKGNVGPANENSYLYRAMILTAGGDVPVATAEGTINNLASKADTTPEVLVYYNSETKTLQLSPDRLALNTGDTATWYFMNLPADAFASFRFDPVDPGMSEAFGPFIAFYALGGNSLMNVRAGGTGFAAAFENGHAPAQFTYHLQVRDSQGTLLASHDPIIDNLGPPPPG